MAFTESKFSEQGLKMLSEVASGGTLALKRIYVDSIKHPVDDLNQTPEWWSNATTATMTRVDTTLSSAGHITDQARVAVAMELRPGYTTTKIKTIIVTATAINAGAEGPERVLCGVMDDNGVDVILNLSGTPVKTLVSIYFKFNATSDITIENLGYADYVLHSELDRLVSCHKVGDPTTGEDQTIKGNKTFNDSIVTNTELKIKGPDCSQEYNGAIIPSNTNMGLTFKTPGAGLWGSHFAFYHGDTRLVNIGYSSSTEGYISSPVFEASKEVRALTIKTNDLQPRNKEVPDIALSGNLVPTTDIEYHIGTTEFPLADVNSYSFHGNTFECNSSGGSDQGYTIKGTTPQGKEFIYSLSGTGLNYEVTTEDESRAETWTGSVNPDINTNELVFKSVGTNAQGVMRMTPYKTYHNNSMELGISGTSDISLTVNGNIIANNVTTTGGGSLLRSPQNGIVVGSIVTAFTSINSLGGALGLSGTPGTVFNVPNNSAYVGETKDGTNWSSILNMFLPAGTYVALSGWQSGNSKDNKIFILLQRTA